MDSITNDLVREVYRGQYSAFDSLMDLLSNKMQRRLNGKFRNLPETKRYDLIPDFAVNFYSKVKEAHEEANRRIQHSSRKLTADEIDALKIQLCSVIAKFDLSEGTSFENWMWVCLWRLAINELRRLKIQVDIADEEDIFRNFPKHFPRQLYLRSEQGELKDYDMVVELLRSALSGDELIYFEVWLDQEPDPDNYLLKPDNDLVKDAIAKQTGKTVNDAYITNLKQSVMMKCYLQLLEHSDKVNSLAAIFQGLMRIKAVLDDMFLIMMENIWQAFYEDADAVSRFRTEISPTLWARWETSKQKRKIQAEILVEAYRHFRFSEPLPYFCYRIELYSNNRFGTKVRQLFMEGGAKN